MSTILYYYTLTILLLSIVSSAVCLSVFLVSRKRFYAYAAVGFAVYFFDVALVFRTDISRHSTANSSVYDINGPLESVLLGGGLLAAFWLASADYLGRPAQTAIPPVVFFVVASVTALIVIPPGKWREFLFFGMRGLAIIALLAFVGVHYATVDDRLERKRLLQHRTFYFVLWLLALCTIAWNVHFQLAVDYSTAEPALLPFMPERNFAENALLLACAYQAVRGACVSLRIRYENPPRSVADRRQEFLDRSIRNFGNAFGLSERERQVLAFVLDGKDNRSIAGELFLAVSTVKVHVHNILSKTGTANRSELTHAFWARI